MQIIGYIAAIAALVCYVIVLIQLFQSKGALHAVLGVICGLYPFIWGWMNASKLNLQKVMILWTIFGLLAGGFAGTLGLLPAFG